MIQAIQVQKIQIKIVFPFTLISRNRAIKKHFHCLEGDEIERLNDDKSQAIA
jgi:hypothetical protein